MNSFTLVFCSLRFHARSHLGALLGAAVGSAVLVGALVVGDSVRESLRHFALLRLGKIDLALNSGDRFFRSDLMFGKFESMGNIGISALQFPATASADGGAKRANHVQLLGVDERFWGLCNQTPSFQTPFQDGVVLNRSLAEQLEVKPGDSILLRVPKPSRLSREAPISPQEDYSVALRVDVRAIASDEEFGRFSLQASQIPPLNAFVPLAWLQAQLKLAGQANLLLLNMDQDPWALDAAAASLRKAWRLADAQLELREIPEAGVLELRTSRIFMDAPIAEAALKVAPGAGGVLTYFVNELRVGDRTTPYSMVAAIGEPIVPREMKEDEILINQWLADDLKAKPGDELKLTYYVVGTMRKLEERTNQFRIHGIVPMAKPFADRSLMPDFPGMAEAKDCRDWDTGFPIQLDRIRQQDNKYWEENKGTPKAFVALAAGQKMWSSRFGNLTAVRYPLQGTTNEVVRDALLRAINPASIGLNFEPVRKRALAAVGQSQDFGQLFLGFSFFLIIAALLLMALLFQFGLEQRTTEIGTLLALGFTPRHVRRLFLLEAAGLALLGGVAGTLGGAGYARAMLHGLSTVWRDAAGTSSLEFHASPISLLVGGISGALVAWLTIWIVLRKQARQPARELLALGLEAGSASGLTSPAKASRGFWIGILGFILTSVIIGSSALIGGKPGVEEFFSGGALLLISGLGFASAFLASLTHSDHAARPTVGAMAVRNATRRRKRSLATIALLASGSFMVIAVGVFRLDSEGDAQKRSSGTGGFALIGETTLPLVHDLNSEAGHQFFGFNTNEIAGVEFVPLRVRDGEDASCLNLNRAQKPRLLGVRPELLDQRHAFSFAAVAKGLPSANAWRLLERQDDGAVPAIGDQASIEWALGKKIGDTLDYTDERGKTFKIRLVASVANSILQGSLLISEKEFLDRFSDEQGYRMFLIDAPSNQVKKVSDTLSRALRDAGIELTPTARRLAAFNAVQNTYLNTFQVLGGLGLLLGSVGLGVVVLRNVMERRGELALLLAVGFRPRSLRWLVIGEHGALLLAGLGIGVISALVAVSPTLLNASASLPSRSLALTLAAVFFSGIIWTWLAALLALRGRLLDSLRAE